MRQSLWNCRRLIIGGVFLSIAAAAATYLIERQNLQSTAATVTTRQLAALQREMDRVAAVLRGSIIYLDGSNPGAQQLSTLIDSLDPEEGGHTSWIWARSLPRPYAPGDVQSLAALAGAEGFAIADHQANRQWVSPVVMALGEAGTATPGNDLQELSGLAAISPGVGNTPRLFLLPVPAGSGGTDAHDGQLALGAVASVPGGRGTQNILLRLTSATKLAERLGISGDQLLRLSAGPGGEVLLQSAAGSVPPRTRIRSFEWNGNPISAALSPHLPPMRHWLWLATLGMGFLLTALLTFLRAGVIVGERASTLGRELATTATRLSDVHLKEQALFNNAGAAICETDYNTGRIVRVNDRMCELMGYEREELTGKTFAEITHPDDLHISQAAIAAVNHPATPISQFEKRYLRRDGSAFWALVNARIVRNSVGEPTSYATIIIDITERKLSEDVKAALLKELAHRVRNTVQLTASLARQTARHARSVKTYEMKFQRRLNALKNTHDILFDADWRAASLQALANRVLAPFMSSTGDTPLVTIDLPAVPLPPQHAQTFAIALMELAANSATHGALAHGGSVILTGEIDRLEDRENILAFRWTEKSPTRVQRPRRKGFGTSILFGALPNQFGGTAEARWPHTGMIYEAHLPLPSL